MPAQDNADYLPQNLSSTVRTRNLARTGFLGKFLVTCRQTRRNRLSRLWTRAMKLSEVLID